MKRLTFSFIRYYKRTYISIDGTKAQHYITIYSHKRFNLTDNEITDLEERAYFGLNITSFVIILDIRQLKAVMKIYIVIEN